MKIIAAEEHDGSIVANVQFPDGTTQSVVLPNWATKANIKTEAKRLQDKALAVQEAKTVRADLTDK